MNLRSLETSEMIHLSAPMVTAKAEAHAVLKGHPATVGLLPMLEEAHEGLVATESATGDGARDAEVRRLSAECIRIDRRHDALIRCLWGTLEALAIAPKEPEQGEAYREAATALFPSGLQAQQASYRGQAGLASTTDERLTKEHRATLRGIRTPEGTLLDFVAEWKEAARELGELDTQRARLEAASPERRKIDIVEARNTWIAAMATVVQVVTVAARLEAAARAVVLAPLEKAVSKAERSPKRTGEPEEPTPAEPADGEK